MSALKKPVVILLVTFYGLCLTTLYAWHAANRFDVTGDEPHYLIMADGMVRYRTLEQTRPYADEFRTRRIFSWGLAEPGDIPSPSNTHAVQGPNGLFNAHNIGLPVLFAIPFAIAGTGGVKVFLILFSGLAVYCAWRLAQELNQQRNVAMWSVAAVTFGLPLIPAANQIYPDLVGGVCALAAVTSLLLRSKLTGRSRKFGDLLGLFSAAFLPWLHLKFAIVAGILTLGFCGSQLSSQSRKVLRLIGMLLPLCLSVGLLALYNWYAFGSPSGPYSDGALDFSWHSFIIFVGLYIDQFQGMLIQNPSYLLAVLFTPLFIRRKPWLGGLILLSHLAFIVPNAMHINRYGGLSFAGRFAWSGTLVMIPIAIFALSEIAKHLGRKSRYLFIALLSIQACFYWRYTFTRAPLYNNLRELSAGNYPSFLPWLKGYTPILYDQNWSFSYQQNIVWGITLLVLLLLGCGYAVWEHRGWFYRGVVGVGILGTISAATSVSPFPTSPINLPGSVLPSHVGEIEGFSLVAKEGRDQAGFLSFGPLALLPPGPYRVTFVYAASAQNPEAIVGHWDVYETQNASVLKTGAFPQTGGSMTQFDVDFEVPEQLAEARFETRVLWDGVGELALQSIKIDPLD